jgi:diguanylate cyclase (GGDEF)-like protein/PAS domain S-box-containing protein
MEASIKVLLVEDTVEDADLLIREMRKGGLEIVAHRVETREALEHALETLRPDVILSDYALPGFGGMAALETVKQHRLDIPFIFVSGTIGEERAIEALKQGAIDYVLKDNRARLVPAIRRAVTEANERRARRQAESELEESEHRFRLFMQHLPGAAFMKDLAGHYTYVSPGAERVIGKKADAIIGRSTREAFPAAYADQSELHDRAAIASRKAVASVEEVPTADGIRFFDMLRFPIFDREGKTVLSGGIALDITERIAAEKAQREGASLMNGIIESALDCILAIDHQGRILQFNPAAEVMFGRSREAVLGKSMAEMIIPPRFRAAHRRGFAHYLATGEGSIVGKRLELAAMRPDGTEFPIELAITAITSQALPMFVGHIRDISERKKAEERLTYLAHYDALTGLPNRNLFQEQLSLASGRARRSGQMLALMFLDLDRFKEINDTLGHAAGDLLLKAIARLLKGSLRGIDSIARLGGDEFTIIVEDITDVDQVITIAEKVKAAFSDAIVIDGRELFVTASIGISMDTGGLDVDALLQTAGIAMHLAKEEGRNTYEFYASEMNAGRAGRLDMEILLRRAVARQEFVLHYQPIVAVGEDRIVGVEALIRWNSPELGFVSPAQFIPLAEETGLIVPIGEWVLSTACLQARAWQNQGIQPLAMSVNLSPRQFRQKNLVEMIAGVLEKTGLDASLLDLEITEGMIMHRADQAVAVLGRLHELGVRLSVDDFGTGYSSLSYLKRFPVQTLKIDRSFVNGLTADGDDGSIVTAIVAMAKSLKLEVIAEGVETAEQLAFLARLPCDKYQGYLFSRPIPANDCIRLLERSARIAGPAVASFEQ